MLMCGWQEAFLGRTLIWINIHTIKNLNLYLTADSETTFNILQFWLTKKNDFLHLIFLYFSGIEFMSLSGLLSLILILYSLMNSTIYRRMALQSDNFLRIINWLLKMHENVCCLDIILSQLNLQSSCKFHVQCDCKKTINLVV